MAATPKGSGGRFLKISDATGTNADSGMSYVPGDDPWNEPMLFDPATSAPVPGQDQINLGPRHAPLRVVGNPVTGWRYENTQDWAPGIDPASSGGATPQGSAADAAKSDPVEALKAAAVAYAASVKLA